MNSYNIPVGKLLIIFIYIIIKLQKRSLRMIACMPKTAFFFQFKLSRARTASYTLSVNCPLRTTILVNTVKTPKEFQGTILALFKNEVSGDGQYSNEHN